MKKFFYCALLALATVLTGCYDNFEANEVKAVRMV